MTDFQKVENEILAKGMVDDAHLDWLKQKIGMDSRKITRTEADFLVSLHKRVEHKTAAFEEFYYQSVKAHLLQDGRINAEETSWLRRMFFSTAPIKEDERKFLNEIKQEAKVICREFDFFFSETMKIPDIND